MSVFPVSQEDEDFTISVPDAPDKFSFAEGEYAAQCAGYEVTTSGAGNQMIVISFLGLEGPTAGNTFKTFIPLIPSVKFKLTEAMLAMNIPKNDKGDYVVNKKNLTGKAVTLFLSPEKNKVNRTFMAIKNIYPPKVIGAPVPF